MRAFKKIAIFAILIGVMAIAFNIAFGNQTITLIEKVKYQYGNANFYYYKFDFATYVQNLQMSITNVSTLSLNMPTREWQAMTDILNWDALANDLALIGDYIILIINVLLYPLRIGAYLVKNLLAIIGVNTDISNSKNGLAWLIELLEWLIDRVQIPYITY